MLRIQNFLIFICFSFFACQVPNSSESLASSYFSVDTDLLFESKVTGVLLEKIAFPIWWVEPGYMRGGSPKVLVFTKDGLIYSRKDPNESLQKSGKWQINAGVLTVHASQDILMTTSFDGAWDGFLAFNDRRLIPGIPDYRPDCLVKHYEGLAYYHKDLERKFPLQIMIQLKNQGINMTLIENDNVQNMTLDGSWSISDLGDRVFFHDLSRDNHLELSYSGLDRGISATISTFEDKWIDTKFLPQVSEF